MTRTRTKNKKAERLTSTVTVDSSSTPASSSQPTIASLLTKAQDLIIQTDYALAHKFLDRILVRTDGSTREERAQAREMLGVVLLEEGKVDEARQAFQALLPPSSDALPSPPASAHLYLAQLAEEPQQALTHYETAIEILKGQLKNSTSPAREAGAEGEDADAEVRGNIVRAYVGMVEVWMDPSLDLCFDPAASSTCDTLLSAALSYDPIHTEALQALASVRLSQSNPPGARTALLRALSAWHALPAADPRVPPLPVKLSLSRLLLETGMLRNAVDVLSGCIEADDENVEGWYLQGWAFWLMAERTKDGKGVDVFVKGPSEARSEAEVEAAEAGEAFEQGLVGAGAEEWEQLGWEDLARDARDCLETCKALHRRQDDPDAPLLEHANELIAGLEALGIQPSPIDGSEGGDDDDEWEEASDDEDGDVEMGE
ncbi:hypothetical protein CONPUDRAFT_163073, partial [Coniophora puteana RWD-64-598 SS2]